MVNTNKKLPGILMLVVLFLMPAIYGFAQEADYHGFRCLNFKFEGHDAKIVFPKQAEKVGIGFGEPGFGVTNRRQRLPCWEGDFM